MARRAVKRKNYENNRHADAKKSKAPSRSSTTHLMDMPTEILLNMIGMLRVQQRCHVRCSCKRMRDIVDWEMHTDLCRIVDTSFSAKAVCNVREAQIMHIHVGHILQSNCRLSHS